MMSPILQVPSYLSQAGITSEMQEGEVTLYEHHQIIPILSSSTRTEDLQANNILSISILLLPSTVICLYPHTHESLVLTSIQREVRSRKSSFHPEGCHEGAARLTTELWMVVNQTLRLFEFSTVFGQSLDKLPPSFPTREGFSRLHLPPRDSLLKPHCCWHTVSLKLKLGQP